MRGNFRDDVQLVGFLAQVAKCSVSQGAGMRKSPSPSIVSSAAALKLRRATNCMTIGLRPSRRHGQAKIVAQYLDLEARQPVSSSPFPYSVPAVW